MAVRFGVTLPAFEAWSDPREVVALAVDAESAGWDGCFLWDHVTWDPAWGGTPAIADPWGCLAAVACATERLRLGPLVTPLARRRPQQVARQLVTLDHLSGGRAVLGVGLGADVDFTDFGEPLAGRAARLDESLAVLQGLLSGQAVVHDGTHLQVRSAPFLPRPVQARVPIWVAGWWPNPAPFHRAARFDGVVPGKVGQERGEVLTPEDLAAVRAAVGRDDPFDYVASGRTSGPEDREPRRWVEAGATWWLESLHPFGGQAEAMRERVRRGPPGA